MKNKELVELLKLNKLHISTAESCTGGMIASSIVDIAGSSSVFDEAFVLYANKAKVKRIGVDKDLITKYGVVSEEVTYQMAEGLSKETNADVTIATSGIAGPDGGTDTKPVGMVCFGFSICGHIYTETKYFNNIGRDKVRKSACEYAIDKCYELLKENLK